VLPIRCGRLLVNVLHMILALGPSFRLQHLFDDLLGIRALTRSVIRKATRYSKMAHGLLIIFCCAEELITATRGAIVPSVSGTMSIIQINASASQNSE